MPEGNYGTTITECTCTSNEQDKIYGKFMRLHNNCSFNKQPMKATRCTVCGKTKQLTNK